MIAAVSFDVWNTLLKIDTVYHELSKNISVMKGLELNYVERKIYEVYRKVREMRLYVNDSNEVRSFVSISRNILARSLGIDYDDVIKAVNETFSTIDASGLLFEDVVPTLDLLDMRGISMGIVGNTVFWESIYTRELLENLNLKNYFKIQLYSDEVGIFKPDKRIFLEFCKRLGVKPIEVIHVGDNVIEDVGGAISVGMNVVLINRSYKKMVLPTLGIMIATKLDDVIEAIQIFSQVTPHDRY